MIRDRLDEARRRLLDLSRRNRLLNFKPNGPSVIRIVDENPSAVYDYLCVQQSPMRFLPAEDAPQLIHSDAAEPTTESASEHLDLPVEPAVLPAGDAPSTDLFLQTAHPGQRLQSLLLNLSRLAESALQEQGCNILYLTIGLLEWADRAGTQSLAPLLLVPVELRRRSVRHRYVVRALDEESVVNPVLREMCRLSHHVELPEFDTSQEYPIAALFEAMGRIMVPGQGWTLRSDMHLAALSFAKHLMYLDLDPQRWPQHSRLDEHPLVVTLCGLASPWPRRDLDIIAPTDLDDRVPPKDTFQVLDADSSQELAILAAKRGVSLVIEGPPGTGKSQTITNIIAECLSEGKTVLFVAEKAVALDVVKRRLEQVGLGSFVAELHSRKASKRAFVEDLARALAQDASAAAHDEELSAEDLARLRATLNHYVRALHRPVQPLGLTPFEAVGHCAALEHAPEAAFELPDLMHWSREHVRAAHEALIVYAEAFSRVGDADSHPWCGTGVMDLPLTARQALPGMLEGIRTALRGAIASSRRLADTFKLGRPETIEQALAVAKAADALIAFPKDEAAVLRNAEWNAMPDDVQAMLTQGRRLEHLREVLEDRWIAAAETHNWSDVAEAWQRLAHRRFRFTSPTWWAIRRAVRQHLQPGARPKPERISEDLTLLTEARKLAADLRRQHTRGETLFGKLWKGDASTWGELERRAAALVLIRQPVAMSLIDDDAIEQACVHAPARSVAQPAIDAMRWASEKLRHEFRALAAALKLDVSFLGQPLERTTFSDLDARLNACAKAGVPALDDWIDLSRTTHTAAGLGLRPFLDWTRGPGRDHPPKVWPDAFLRQFHRLWLDNVVRDSEALRGFRVADHERTIDAFRATDAKWLAITRARLAQRIAVTRPRLGQATTAATGLGILEAEVRRRRNIKPIRRLLASPCAEPIQKLKPCFMMSPISIAQYLEPGRLAFDVVIFDEASQIEPADAIGALARGRQVILVGDEKQLPPTNFFASIIGEDSQDGGSELAMPSMDLESVLSVGQAHLPARTTLRWHYRSRHESLIDFSNGEFYDGSLRVFPSPYRFSPEYGLRLVPVPDGVYHRARGQHNPIEAARVAEAVLRHARERPDVSLGVGAFSVAQQRAIEDQIERLRLEANDSRVEAFFDPGREEPFFVKNLETVQGDERDAMILSVGYGPDETGRVINNFGPLNQEGGWRRLNVLVTRARVSCTIYATLRPEQIRVDAATPRGVRALRAYLENAQRITQLAESAAMEPSTRTAGEMNARDTLVAVIAKRLRERGLRVETGVGCEGFAIDLAIVDESGARCAVGIETDGAVYASCPTARDRDRLRGMVLRNLGWRLVRTWAVEWAADSQRALRRLLDAIERAEQDPAARMHDHIHGAADASAPTECTSGTFVDEENTAGSRAISATPNAATPSAPPPGVVPYVRFKTDPIGDRAALMATPLEALGDLVRQIAAVEGPIHVDELVRLVCDAYQARAVGQAPDHVRAAVKTATRLGIIRIADSFVLPAEMDHPPVRWRDSFEAVTSPDLIWPEEVAESAIWIVRNEFGAMLHDLPASALRRMGFRRITPALEALGRTAVERAITSGRLIVDSERYVRIGRG